MIGSAVTRGVARRGARSPAGFTLLEVLVALVLASIVALLVYGAARAGSDVEARLATHRRGVQTERAARAVLQDALRNVRLGARADDSTFVLDARRDARGRPVDRLSFKTSGGLPPLTSDANWLVTVEPTPAGLAVVGVPAGVRAAPRLLALLPGVTGLAVRVLARDSAASWAERWSFPALLPRAVELTYWSAAGPLAPPLRVALPLGEQQ